MEEGEAKPENFGKGKSSLMLPSPTAGQAATSSSAQQREHENIKQDLLVIQLEPIPADILPKLLQLKCYGSSPCWTGQEKNPYRQQLL
ncbi:hypothetical protein GN956_G3688 [Arapaima gigas]